MRQICKKCLQKLPRLYVDADQVSPREVRAFLKTHKTITNIFVFTHEPGKYKIYKKQKYISSFINSNKKNAVDHAITQHLKNHPCKSDVYLFSGDVQLINDLFDIHNSPRTFFSVQNANNLSTNKKNKSSRIIYI